MSQTQIRPSSFWQQYVGLTIKEVKIQLRYPLSYISWFITIFLMIALFTITAKLFIDPDDTSGTLTTGRLATYIFWGFLAMSFFGDALFTLGSSLRNEQQTGTLETLFLYPMNHLANLLAKISFATFSNVFFSFIGYGAIVYLTGAVQLEPLALPLFVCYLAQIYGLSFLLAGLSLKLKESIEPIVGFMQFAFMIFGGFFFPFAVLQTFVGISFLIPMSYSIDLVRSVTFGTTPELASIAAGIFGNLSTFVVLEWAITVILTVTLPVGGYRYFIRTLRKGRFSGTLSDY